MIENSENQILSVELENNDIEELLDDNNTSQNQDIPDEEPAVLEAENANTTNCLALTIKQNYKLVAVKNVFFRSIRMSWKVIVSSITLTILKLLS